MPGALDIGAVTPSFGASYAGREELILLGASAAGAEIDVVRAQRHAGELRIRVGILEGRRPPVMTPTPFARLAAFRPSAAVCSASNQRSVPLHRRCAGWSGDLGPFCQRKAKRSFVRDPRFVDVHILLRHAADHSAAAIIDADGRARGVVLGD